MLCRGGVECARPKGQQAQGERALGSVPLLHSTHTTCGAASASHGSKGPHVHKCFCVLATSTVNPKTETVYAPVTCGR